VFVIFETRAREDWKNAAKPVQKIDIDPRRNRETALSPKSFCSETTLSRRRRPPGDKPPGRSVIGRLKLAVGPNADEFQVSGFSRRLRG
jgi:hypothetical protein